MYIHGLKMQHVGSAVSPSENGDVGISCGKNASSISHVSEVTPFADAPGGFFSRHIPVNNNTRTPL